jgi:CRISPR system Cascade subunit CasC
MFIELHMIQNFVPSNLNRDDTGSPKDCVFGGHRRARVSSQCLKRSIRTHLIFAQTTQVPISKRTHSLASEVAKKLINVHGKAAEQAQEISVALASEYTKGMDKRDPTKSSVLVFISDDEVQTMADQLAAHWDDVTGNEKSRDSVIKEIVKEMVKQYQRSRRCARYCSLWPHVSQRT